MKSTMTLNRSLFRLASQVSAFAHRRGETVVEYKQGWLYCYPKSRVADIFDTAPDSNEVVAIYNATDAYTWRKDDAPPRSRSRHTA